MRWVTRENVGVAGTACPWLITRFIDDDAEFGFFPPAEAAKVAAAEDAEAFDLPDAQAEERGGAFAALVFAHNLARPGLDGLTEIVTAAERGDPHPIEAPGLVAIVAGVAREVESDVERQRLLWPVYDALLAYCAAREDTDPV